MSTFVLYALLATAAFYLGCAAKITAPIHTRLPNTVYTFLACPFCSGTWYGMALAVTLGRHFNWGFFGLAGDSIVTPFAVGGVTMITTPLLAALAFRASEIVNATLYPETEKPNDHA